jgi:hypothetical protein
MKKQKARVRLERQKHKRALTAARRRAAFKKLKEQWKLGIGLYERETQEERDKPNQL